MYYKVDTFRDYILVNVIKDYSDLRVNVYMFEYERIKNYICNEERMKPFIEQAEDECMRINCQSWTTILELAIEKLLDAYEDKCEELNSLEKNNF